MTCKYHFQNQTSLIAQSSGVIAYNYPFFEQRKVWQEIQPMFAQHYLWGDDLKKLMACNCFVNQPRWLALIAKKIASCDVKEKHLWQEISPAEDALLEIILRQTFLPARESDWKVQLVARSLVEKGSNVFLKSLFQGGIFQANRFWLENIWQPYLTKKFETDFESQNEEDDAVLKKILFADTLKVILAGDRAAKESVKQTLLGLTEQLFPIEKNEYAVWLFNQLKSHPPTTAPNSRLIQADQTVLKQALEKLFARDSLEIEWRKHPHREYLLWLQQNQEQVNWQSSFLQKFARDHSLPQPLEQNQFIFWKNVENPANFAN